MAILLSFDIDGTLETGDPPGGITIDMVRKARDLGFLVGSCSDKPISAQKVMWERFQVPVLFTVAKHQLPIVRDAHAALAYFHIGDTDVDYRAAHSAGFGFWWNHEGVNEPWLLHELATFARRA
jgi:phosphoglycolate phosphatase-like HAD superfamily hydrolase